MRIIGLDVGDKRTGVALSDPLGILASPLLVFEHKDDVADIETILQRFSPLQVQSIFVPVSSGGAPYHPADASARHS